MFQSIAFFNECIVKFATTSHSTPDCYNSNLNMVELGNHYLEFLIIGQWTFNLILISSSNWWNIELFYILVSKKYGYLRLLCLKPFIYISENYDLAMSLLPWERFSQQSQFSWHGWWNTKIEDGERKRRIRIGLSYCVL